MTPPSGPLRRSVAGLFAPSVPWLILPSCICWALLLWPLAYHSLQLVDRDVALMLANAVDGLRELLGKASEEGETSWGSQRCVCQRSRPRQCGAAGPMTPRPRGGAWGRSSGAGKGPREAAA